GSTAATPTRTAVNTNFNGGCEDPWHWKLDSRFYLKVNMAIVLEEPTFYENVLNYALYAGAVFQLLCIFAAITISQSPNEKEEEEEAAIKLQTSSSHQASRNRPQETASRRGKKEKKKHR
ncbi:hypothetical protein EGW08_004242, partial [Elysia chlorotica]